ncbi:three-helix bundle dimerization domain-containing protein [Actinopolymorpha singaporensis]
MAQQTDQKAAQEAAIPQIVETLTDRYDPVPPETVERFVLDTFAELDARSKVKTFLSTLTERLASERLNTLR